MRINDKKKGGKGGRFEKITTDRQMDRHTQGQGYNEEKLNRQTERITQTGWNMLIKNKKTHRQMDGQTYIWTGIEGGHSGKKKNVGMEHDN